MATKKTTPTPEAGVTVLHDQFSYGKGNQTATLVRLVEVESLRLRFKITQDNSYHFQSTALVELWNPFQLEWKPVYSLPHFLMANRQRNGAADYKSEYVELLRLARLVLSL